MNNPGQTHWANCATEGGPAHYECAVKEVERLRALIETAGRPWLHLNVTPPIPWEGGIDGAMEAACREITRLRALTTPQPIETAPKDGTHILIHDNDGWSEDWWSDQHETWLNADVPTHWLPLPEAPK